HLIHHTAHAPGSVHRSYAEPRTECREGCFRRVTVETHLAAEEAIGVEVAEHEVRIGDGRLGAAAAVAYRARHRSGAVRSDSQRADRADRGDRATAGADL